MTRLGHVLSMHPSFPSQAEGLGARAYPDEDGQANIQVAGELPTSEFSSKFTWSSSTTSVHAMLSAEMLLEKHR